MNRTKRWGSLLFICLIFFGVIIYSIDNHVNASTVQATEYVFYINSQLRNPGTEYEMTNANLLMYIADRNGYFDPGATVSWTTSNPHVVDFGAKPTQENFMNLVRKGPGYTSITATIQLSNGSTVSRSILIKVALDIDTEKMGLTTSTTTQQSILVFNEIGGTEGTKPILLKHVDYTGSVSGAAVTGIIWESKDDTVVSIENGIATAKGAGTTEIVVRTTTTTGSNQAMQKSLRVVVRPRFELTWTDDLGTARRYPSESTRTTNAIKDVPSSFQIQSNALSAKNLHWVVKDRAGNIIAQTDQSKMSYEISELSGIVNFSNVKAGTYEIFAFAHKDYNEQSLFVPYAYIRVEVPIRLKDQHIVMNVGDVYNILENSNIPSVSTFQYGAVDQNIASVINGRITARSKGQITLTLTYNAGTGLYDPSTQLVTFNLTVTVIDGIALSMTSAKMFIAGELQLQATVTDETIPIVWSSSKPDIATVENGLVKARAKGTTTITASQRINGIVKSATCVITVSPAVSSITLNPANITMAIGKLETITATVAPTDISNVNLTWRSSNPNVVSIESTNNLSVVVKGQRGGSAVIAAINQDNIVVGYCHITVLQPVTGISLSETNIVVDLSMKNVQLRATVTPENATNKKIIWSSTDPTKARVNQNGLVTFLKPGSVSIIATSEDNPIVTAYCNITINIPVASIALDETTKTMFVGQTARLTYLVLPNNSSNASVTWTSTNPAVVTVDNTGRVTAKSVGTAVIILRAVDGGQSVYCTINVKRVASGVKFEVNELSLKTGESYTLTPILTPNDSTDTQLLWESTDTKIATVDAKGKVTGRAAGTAIIMVRTEAGAIAMCKITVTTPVRGVIINMTERTLFIKDKFELKASVNPSNASNLTITWSSSNTKVATVNSNGVVEGIKGGIAIITATTVDGGFSASCVVTVREPITTITLNKKSYNLGLGKTYTLKATVTTESATNPKVRWVSSNPKVATVTQNGLVKGISLGRATITAIAQDGSKVEASCEIRVVRPVTSVTFDKTYMNLLVGQKSTIKATIRPSTATIRTLKWKSSDESIAIVDNRGVVTALKAGSVTITGTANDNSGHKAVSYVIVRERVPATSIKTIDTKVTMVTGETKTVQVSVNPSTSTDSYTWSSDNTGVATVDKKTGRITARGIGRANITVMTESGKTAVVEVTVIGLNITSITIQQYTDYPYPLRVEGATGRVDWSIDNPNIATVVNGRVSSRAVGTTTIRAKINGRTLTCRLTVTKIK